MTVGIRGSAEHLEVWIQTSPQGVRRRSFSSGYLGKPGGRAMSNRALSINEKNRVHVLRFMQVPQIGMQLFYASALISLYGIRQELRLQRFHSGNLPRRPQGRCS